MTTLELLAVSAVTGGLAEFGDKTQLLLCLLAARLKRPVPVFAGLVVATLTNRLAAGVIADWASGIVVGQLLQTVVGLMFVGLAVWVLAATEESMVPIAADEWMEKLGPFAASAAAFFLAEIGDKTQVATLALTARFGMPVVVSVGTTLGLIVASLPVLFLSGIVGKRLPLRVTSLALAMILSVMGVMTLMGFTGWR